MSITKILSYKSLINVEQTFEKEVNGLKDITYLDTQFIFYPAKFAVIIDGVID